MSESDAALARLESLLGAPSAESMEEAAALVEALAARAGELRNERAGRSLELSLRLAVQARDHFGGLKQLLEARTGHYTAEGCLRLPEDHRLTLEG